MSVLAWFLWAHSVLWVVAAPASFPNAFRTFTETRPVASAQSVAITSLVFGALALASLAVRFRTLPRALASGKLDRTRFWGRFRILLHCGFAWFLAFLFSFGGLSTSVLIHDLTPVLGFGPAALLLVLIETPKGAF